MIMFKFLKQTPVQLFLSMLCAMLIGTYFSTTSVRFFMGISVSIKNALMFFLPFIVFFYIAYALATFKKAAPILIILTVLFIVSSNALAVLTVYGVAHLIIDQLCAPFVNNFCAHPSSLTPLFELPVKAFIPTEWTMLCGIICGVYAGYMRDEKVVELLNRGRSFVTFVLKNIFVPVLPLYVFGFVLKLNYDGDLMFLVHNYAKIFLFSIGLILTYLSFMYLIAAQFNLGVFFEFIKNISPASITAFSTMSSAATMPITLTATEKNLESIHADKEYADYIIPISTNIHLIGDGLSISLTALALLYMSGHPLPDFHTYLIFTFWYCIAKFSTAGVPGAGVIVILPVMQKYLYLSPEMTSILTTIYVLKDSLLTSTNVTGNGAFALITYRIFRRLKIIQ